jgi:threonylcarbamoyladenosine tRNA methylthiotransferase MtaB
MRTFAIVTLGCKVNQYESQQIREILEQCGLEQVEPTERSDLVVVNTCCVTHTASARSRQHIRKSGKLNPDAIIVVSGCLTTVQIGELPAETENLRYAGSQKQLAAILRRIVSGEVTASEGRNLQTCTNNTIRPETSHKIKPKTQIGPQNASSAPLSKNSLPAEPSLPTLSSFEGHTRAFLKVQDGCDGCCSYCIVPKTRPFVRSRTSGEVIAEARTLVEGGHKEIVVTGIFLGAYGLDTVRRRNWANRQNDKLSDLLKQLAQIPNLARIRLSSLEPGDVTERLLDTFCEYRNIMPHLHLSLQSGSNAVLKKMCRQYDVEAFRRVVEKVKARLDRPAITTDIIVGFPGETDVDFEDTVQLAREVGFAKMHIFPFSARKGTAAAKMQSLVNARVIKKRSQIMRDLNAELAGQFREQFIGESAKVLVEGGSDPPSGRSERYFMVFLPKTDPKPEKNELINVKLGKNTEKGMLGVPEA